MLERLTIFPKDVDVGSIAEAMIYYGHVELVLTAGEIVLIIEKIGVDQFLRIIKSPFVKVRYNESYVGVQHRDDLVRPFQFIEFTLTKTSEGKFIRDPYDQIEHAIRSKFPVNTIFKRRIREIYDSIHVRDSGVDTYTKGAAKDVEDIDFLLKCLKISLAEFASWYNTETIEILDVSFEGELFYIYSNIDFQKINSILEYQGNAGISMANLIAPIIFNRREIYFSGGFKTDILADPVQSNILKLRS